MLSKPTRSNIVRFVSVVVLVGAVIMVFQALRGTDSDLVAAILQESSTAAATVTSYKVVSTGTQTYDNGDVESGTTVLRVNIITGTAEASVLDENGNIESQTIIIDEIVYVSATVDPPTWYSMPNPASLVSDSGMAAGALLNSMRASLTDVTKAGNRVEDGRTIEVLRGRTDLAAKANQLWDNWDTLTSEERRSLENPRRQFLSGQESVELWFDAETYLLVRAIVAADFPRTTTLPGYNFETTHTFSSFNKQFSITAPAASQIVATPEPTTPLAPAREYSLP